MNSSAFFPGTKVTVSQTGLLTGIFSLTKGITLAQVCELTGIEPSTIQNWIKRGYVNPPEKRRYSKRQVARIIIINMLRDTMVIERIARLLGYVNGDLLDISDDIMDDSEIYTHLCDIIMPTDISNVIDVEALLDAVDAHLDGFTGSRPDARERLSLALKVIICNYESANLKRYADRLAKKMDL